MLYKMGETVEAGSLVAAPGAHGYSKILDGAGGLYGGESHPVAEYHSRYFRFSHSLSGFGGCRFRLAPFAVGADNLDQTAHGLVR